jgi:integrase
MALTVKKIAKLTERGRYFDRDGLYLQVQSPTNRSWLLRYAMDGRERWLGLGALRNFTLAEARERARAARQLVSDGRDPIAAKKAERTARALEVAKAITFEEAARQYFDSHEAGWKNRKHRNQFLSTLGTYAFPVIGRLPVAMVDTGLVLKCVEPIWKTKPPTANRVRGRIENVLDWAAVRGFRTGDNPARWKGHLAEVLPGRGKIHKTNHHAALPYADIPKFMATLRAREGGTSSANIVQRALEFTILTAARTSETIGATWLEIDFRAKTWTIPAGRIKAAREHRVPLSDRALELLRALPREVDNPFVFIGGRQGGGLSDIAMLKLLDRMGRGDITAHGFRSTFRDWAAETTSYPNHVVEMALAHTIGSKVEAAYRRGDLFAKRVRLMAEWDKFCSTKPADAAEIVALQAVRR